MVWGTSRLRRHGKLVAAAALVSLAGLLGSWFLGQRPSSNPFERAWDSLRAGRTKEVREQLDLMAADSKWQVHRQVLRAGLLIHAGNARAAIQLLPETSSDEELFFRIQQLRGQCLYMLGEYLEAHAIFVQLAELRPKDSEPHRALGAVYFDMGYLAMSTAELHKAIELDPQDARSHRILGRLELDAQHQSQAIEHLRTALPFLTDADRDEVIVEIATAQIQLQQFAAAVTSLQQLTKPTVEALALKAECERSLGDTEKAIHTLESALSKSRTSPKAAVLRAQWHLEANEPDRAVPLLLDVLAASPFDLESRYVLAQAYRRLKENEKAEQETKRWEEIRDLQKEFHELQDKLWRNPTDDALRQRLIVVARQIGKTSIAEFWQRSRPPQRTVSE